MTDEKELPRDNTSGVDPRLLEVLICPVTRQGLTYDRAANELVSAKARLAFPIRNGIPIMLAEEARDLDLPVEKEGPSE
ncbi:hypothetical protein HY29_14470 [Hyphomonas beringensis]|uniref:UPF0434 protein HY29_14470 n=1 Tax=Hyphomonas beringensis TaxID=1280946 RepID=A0A062U1Y8_9PROT|nr:Trm112 family protein [Hyphomonas beringensis]KCZ54351.1 hypothetical protein HY29_14470 [Hyphomonas beringensis]